MRQPPRQPPRQQPKAAARRQPQRPTAKGAAPKAGAAKSGARQQRGQSGNAARAAQHARDAQRQAQRTRQQQSARGRGRQQGKGRAPQQNRPLRGWRSWWATHEMDKRNQTRRRGARGGVGGGFGVIDSFGGPRAAGVLTLLLLAFFTGAVALGAQSIAAAVLAFLFLAGAIAVVTAARARHHFAAEPVETEAPLEKVAEFHIDDLKTEDEPSEAEVNSLADLERSFKHENEKSQAAKPAETTTVPAKAAAPAASVVTVPVTEAEAPDDAVKAGPASDSAAPDAPETGPANESAAEPAAESDPLATAEAAHETIAAEAAARAASSDEAVATEPVPAPSPLSVAEAAAEPATTAAKDEPGPEAKDGKDSEDEDEADDDPAAGDDTDEPEIDAEDYDDIDALMAPLLDPEDETETRAAEPEPSDDSPGTALSLLAAETPGAAPQYPAASSLPPEAVRDVAATLIVADLSRSIMFYTELLGLVEIDRAPDAVLLEAGFGRVLLWRRDDAPGAGDPVMHLTFEVGDIDAAYDSMRAKGIEFIHPPRAALSGEVHSLRAASFLDPDGHGLAITELREHSTRHLIRGLGKTE